MTIHGMMMAPGGGAGSGGGSDDSNNKKPNPEAPRRPSGTAYPMVSPDDSVPHTPIVKKEEDEVMVPMPVVLAKGTFMKFAFLLLGSLLVSVSAILAFYWKHHFEFKTHIGDQTIHLTSGERATLETKSEAQANRKMMVEQVKREVEYKHREIVLKQKEQIQKIGEELQSSQEKKLNSILNEVRRTRRAVSN